MAMYDTTVYECDRCHRKVEGHDNAREWVLLEEMTVGNDSIGEPTLLCATCYEDYCDSLDAFLTLNDTK